MLDYRSDLSMKGKTVVPVLVLASWAAFSAAGLFSAAILQAFGYTWSVPSAADWNITQEDGATVLHVATGREPLPGPRRPMQFAIAHTADFGKVTVEGDARPLGRSLLVVFAYRDAAHFDYAHLSIDTGTKQPNHNGIFH